MNSQPSPSRQPLPIDEVLPTLLRGLRDAPAVLLRAPTGAGKTTRVPVALLEAGLAGDGEILVLQPRRLPARATARRTAAEFGCAVGQEIGYQVRFDSKRCGKTRITFLTEGVYLRRLQQNPFLDGIGAVVFDEFHERHLDGDLALALTRKVQEELRPELKLVLMSATLETRGLREFLGDAPLIESAGRSFPVALHYLPAAERLARGLQRPEDVARVVQRALGETDGDVLVFLPGVGEIKRLHERLRASVQRAGHRLTELYGDLSPEEQDRALEECEGRTVFLSTNVAETSITLPKVSAVVDSGWMRSLQFDPASGLNRLVLTPISNANADQRAGRAGRTRPGVCFRLWTEAEQRSRPPQAPPEIRRVDCTAALLQLVAWGESRPELFPWFEAPPERSVTTGLQQLQQLGAMEQTGNGAWRLTDTGTQLLKLPVHPRLGRLLIEGLKRGVAYEAAMGAALLSERSPFRRDGQRLSPWDGSVDSDLVDQVHALQSYEQNGQEVSAAGELSRGAARSLLRVRDQLLRCLPRDSIRATEGDPDEELARALLAGYQDRLAVRRKSDRERGRMVGGSGVRLARESNVRTSELFLCLDVDARSGEGLVRLASEVRREWLDQRLLTERDVLEFDGATERVLARRVQLFEDLELDSRPGTLVRNAASAAALQEAAASQLDRALNLQQPEYLALCARVEGLAALSPELGLPAVDQLFLREHLAQLCKNKLSFEELRNASLAELVRGSLDWKQRQALDAQFPERIEVPSGNHIAIRYEQGRAPVLAARIQELFGWRETPRIAGGRVPLLLHLLAPNMRPQQVTEDLKSFWDTTYAQVRKDLRRRYPKHDWPEDPWTAVARKRRR